MHYHTIDIRLVLRREGRGAVNALTEYQADFDEARAVVEHLLETWNDDNSIERADMIRGGRVEAQIYARSTT